MITGSQYSTQNEYLQDRKRSMYKELDALKQDIRTLESNIARFEEDLKNVTTMEEAEEFDYSHDLEEGLDVISLEG